jgi:hypothetical protein
VEGEIKITEAVENSSHNIGRIGTEGMKSLLMKLPFLLAMSLREYSEPED